MKIRLRRIYILDSIMGNEISNHNENNNNNNYNNIAITIIITAVMISVLTYTIFTDNLDYTSKIQNETLKNTLKQNGCISSWKY